MMLFDLILRENWLGVEIVLTKSVLDISYNSFCGSLFCLFLFCGDAGSLRISL